MYRAFHAPARLSVQRETVLLMPTTIFPEEDAGGLVVREEDGDPVSQPEVAKAYVPAPTFDINCDLRALPSNCNARIEPEQINAIVSELVALAECFNASGTWDCNSLQNLCTNFQAWALVNIAGIYVGDTPPPTPAPNKLWWESDSGMLFLWFNDGNTTQWVQINGASVFADQVSIVGAGAQFNPFAVGTIDCGVY